MDDWQSFYVLLTLMIGANDQSMKLKADGYIHRANELCKDDTIKQTLLYALIKDLA